MELLGSADPALNQSLKISRTIPGEDFSGGKPSTRARRSPFGLSCLEKRSLCRVIISTQSQLEFLANLRKRKVTGASFGDNGQIPDKRELILVQTIELPDQSFNAIAFNGPTNLSTYGHTKAGGAFNFYEYPENEVPRVSSHSAFPNLLKFESFSETISTRKEKRPRRAASLKLIWRAR
jgi:hypothetical protein